MLEKLFQTTEQKMQKAVDITSKDLASIRTGRASPSLVEKIQVDYYGAPTPLNALASITVPEPRMVVIQPWDRSMIGAIEKAILKSDLGINPSSDGTVVRLIIPQLTEERRKELVKGVHRRAEEGRVAIRNIRREAIEELKRAEKDKQVSEDEAKRAHDRLDKLTQKYVARVDEASQQKEREILEV